MKRQLEERIARAVHRVLKSYGITEAAIPISEHIMEAVSLLVDIESGEDGVASVRPEVAEEVAWDIRSNNLAIQQKAQDDYNARERHVPKAPLPTGAVVGQLGQEERKIILPGDRQFSQLGKANEGGPRSVIVAREIKRSPSRKRTDGPSTQYWEYESLDREIRENTPEEIEFSTINGVGVPVKLTAIRNTHCKIGLGCVALTYRHPSMSEMTGGGSPDIPVNIPLVAQVSFSIYEEKIDLQKAIEDIMIQLHGLYKPRSPQMIPSVQDPGPLRVDMMNQPGDQVYGELKYGVEVENPYNSFRQGLRNENDRLAPPGRRF